MAVTFLLFGSGAIQVDLSLDETQRLVEQALTERRLLVLTAPDGRRLVVNPPQIEYLQSA